MMTRGFQCIRLTALAVLLLGLPALGVSPAGAQSPTMTLRGRVLDAVTREPVAGARVTVRSGAPASTSGVRPGGTSDTDGSFRVGNLPPGLYTLEVEHVAYRPYARAAVQVGGDGGEVVVLLTPWLHELEGITVSPGSYAFMGSSSRQTMTRDEIESVPQFGEDIFRAVNHMPGLSSGDYSAHFSIRGGRQDETLIILDGLEIFEPYHLKDFNEGAISIIDVEAIDGVELMTGGFGAQYGNRTAGVFRMTSRRPTTEDRRYTFGISLVNARVTAEGTFADNRGSWFASARRGYLDLVFKLTGISDLPSPGYTDLFANARYDLNANHSLALNLLYARDTYTFDAAATTGFADSIQTHERANNRYGNAYAWATLESALGKRLRVTTLASVGRVGRDRDGAEIYTSNEAPQYSVTNTQNFSFVGLRQDASWALARPLLLQAGYDARALDADFSILSVVDRNPDDPTPDPDGYYPRITRATDARKGSLLAGYLSARLRVAGPFAVEAGARYDRTTYSGDRNWSPRLSAVYDVGSRTKLRAAWGHYRQSQGIAELSLLDGQQDYFGSELSELATLGIEHQFGEWGALRLEAYRKRGSELRPQYRNWKGGLDVFPESNEDRILVVPDSSVSRGIEAYYTRDVGDRTRIRASYAVSIVDQYVSHMQNLNDAVPPQFASLLPGPQDQRHSLNVEVTRQLGERWGMHVAYAFHTGWPGTAETLEPVVRDDGVTDYTARPLQLYGIRLPDYHRVDVRFTRRRQTARGEMRLFLEVTNLTNHRNVSGYDTYVGLDKSGRPKLVVEPEQWFTILPSVGVSWRF